MKKQAANGTTLRPSRSRGARAVWSQGASESEIKIQSGMVFVLPMKKDIFVLQTILSSACFSESGQLG